MPLRINVTKDLLGEDVVAPHSKEQAGGSCLRAERASKTRGDQHGRHAVEQQHASYTLRDVQERRFLARVGGPVRPNALSEIHLNGAEDACQHANHYRRQQHVTFRILHVFGECGDAVKPDIGERGKGGRRRDRTYMKGGGIIERPNGEYPAPSLSGEEITNRRKDK